MRHNLNGRGAHPNTVDIHRWTFDENTAGAAVQDIIGGEDLVVTGSADTGLGWIGGYRTFFSGPTCVGPTSGADATRLVSTYGLMCAFRLRATPGVTTEIIGYTAVNGGTSATNDLLSVRITSARALQVVWESSSNITRTGTLVGYVVPRHIPVYLVLNKTSSTNIDAIVNGRKVGSITMPAATSGGSSCRWRLLTTPAGASTPLNVEIYSMSLKSAPYTMAECAEAWRRAQRWAFSTFVETKVTLTDSTGTERDLRDIEGRDFYAAVAGGWGVDDASETATVSVVRELDELSFNPEIYNPINITNHSTGAFAPFIATGRKVRVYCARVPLYTIAEAADFILKYEGDVDEYDVGGAPLQLQCRDAAGYVIDDVMEDDVTLPTTLGLGGCGGTAAPLENMIQDLFNLMHESAPSLWTEEPSTLCMFAQEVERGPFMEKAREFAASKGWDIRTRWDANTSTFRIGLFDPGRSRVDCDGVLARREYEALSKYSVSRQNVRNIIRGNVLTDTTTAEERDAEENSVITSVEVQNLASQTKYKKRFMDIRQDATAFIRGQTALSSMLNAALSDLKDPTVEAQSSASDLFELEVHDIVGFQNSRPWFSTDIYLAVTQLSWADEPGVGFNVSTVGLRGVPTLGQVRHLRNDARPDMGERSRPPAVNNTRTIHGIPSSLKLVPQKALLQGTILRGGRFLSVPNGDFSTWLGGASEPPDGWTPASGWGSSIVQTRTTTRTGGLAIAFTVDEVFLVSSYLAVDANNPYTFEVDWQSVSNNHTFQLKVEWFTATHVSISSSTYRPGVGFAAITYVANAWFTSKLQGVLPPATARYCKVSVAGYKVGSPFTNVIVDRVQVIRCAFEMRAFSLGTSTTAPTWGGSMLPKSNIKNVPFATVSSAGSYDRGGLALASTSSPFHGYGATIKEDGTYDIDSKVWIHDGGTGSTLHNFYAAIYKNAVYNASGNLVSGTEIARSNMTAETSARDGAIMPEVHLPGIDLVRGDRITIAFYIENGGANLHWAWAGPTYDPAYFRIKQKLSE